LLQNSGYLIKGNKAYTIIDEELEKILYPTLITRYSVITKAERTFQTYLIARNENQEYFKINIYGLVDLNFGDKVCLICGKRLEENNSISNYCKKCLTISEETYKKCLFYSPKIIYNKKCTIEDIPCKVEENVEKCYSKYMLYFGRFGETIKVGISKINYGSSKYKRLINQGLNEAIVIYPFRSLPEVTAYERMLVDEIGIQEKLTFEDKVENLLTPSLMKIENFYSIKQMKELFGKRKIKKIDIYRDNQLENIISSSFTIKIKKKIKKIRGTIIYTQGNIGLIKNNETITFFDISNLVGRELVRRDNEW